MRRASLLLLLAVPLHARAGVTVVGDPVVYTTIADAVAAASAGDTIEIDAATYDERVYVDKDLTLVGVDGPATTIVEPTWGDYALEIVGATVTLTGLTFTSPVELTGLGVTNATVTIDDVVFTGLAHTGPPALESTSSTITISNSSFSNNTHLFESSSMLVAVGGSVTVLDSTFVGNTRPIMTTDADLTVERCTFDGNEGSILISANGLADAFVRDNTFVNNLPGATLPDKLRNVHVSTTDNTVEITGNSLDGGIYAQSYDLFGGLLTGSVVWSDNTLNGFFMDGAATFINMNVITLDAFTVLAERNVIIDVTNTGTTVLSIRSTDAIVRQTLICGTGGAASAVGYAGWGPDDTSALVLEGSVIALTPHVTDAPIHASYDGTLQVSNTTMLANDGGQASAVYHDNNHVLLADSNVFAWNTGGPVLNAPLAYFGVVPTNLFWDNPGGDVAGGAIAYIDLPYSGNLFLDPLLAGGEPTDCATLEAWQLLGSPVIDQGSLARPDPDGSRNDLGAYGGTYPLDPALFDDDDADGFLAMHDCDDTQPTVWPGADEVCDGLDNDCEGTVDIGAIDPTTWYQDLDFDGYGATPTATVGCDAPPDYVDVDGDCDDASASVHPGAPEVCNGGIDDDCDELADDDTAVDAVSWYADEDGDGFGAVGTGVLGCDAPPDTVDNDDDCDDLDGAAFPGATEIAADGVDQDCDGSDLTEPTDPGGEPGGEPGEPGEPGETPEGGTSAGGCGCDHSAPAPGLLPIILLAAVRRRLRAR